MATYQIIIRDQLGNQLAIAEEFARLDYVRSECEIGMLELTLPRSDVERYFSKDNRIEIWRTIGSKTYLEGGTCWFIRGWRLSGERSNQAWTVTAYDANYLLSGREVEYAAESAYAKKTDYIDDMMKAVVYENLGAGATVTARRISSYMTIQPDFSLAPSTTKSFSRRNVLRVLQELAQESYQKGTYLAFDMAWVSAGSLEFRTYKTALGVDRGRASASPLVINATRGSLVDPVLEWDYSGEITVATAGGTGTEAARVIRTVTGAKVAETIFSRRELFVDAINAKTDTAALDAEANAALYENRPVVMLTGNIQDTSAMIYGIDYNYGDIIVAEHEGYSFDAHISRIRNTVTRDGEKFENKIRGVVA